MTPASADYVNSLAEKLSSNGFSVGRDVAVPFLYDKIPLIGYITLRNKGNNIRRVVFASEIEALDMETVEVFSSDATRFAFEGSEDP